MTTPTKLIRLEGGRADGRYMRVAIARKWVCAEIVVTDQSTGQIVQLDLEQYAPNEHGQWIPINNEHPLYIL